MDPRETPALRQQLLDELVTEAIEHLDAADALLDAADQGGLGADARDRLMRAMHTIKGSAGYMELTDILGLAHALETIVRQPTGDDAPPRLDLLRAGTAELRDLVEHVDTPRSASAELLAALGRADAPPAEPAMRRGPSVAEIFLDVVRQQCHALRIALPRLAGPGDPAGPSDGAPMVLRALASLRSAASYAGRDDVLLLLDTPLNNGTAEAMGAERVARLLDALTSVVSGVAPVDLAAFTPEPSARADHTVEMVSAADGDGQPGTNAAPTPSTRLPTSTDLSSVEAVATLRVPFARVDALMGQVGELLTIRGQLDHFLGQVEGAGCARSLIRQGRLLAGSLGRSVDDLQNTSRELRLVRLETVFRRLPRICRDAAAHTSKQVRLELHGGDTELDKTVAEALADPLLHLLRNAVDHGIERPHERRAGGKPETGVVVVTARQEAAEVVIDVRDDGRGIDPWRIRARAVEADVIDAATAAELSPDGILDLLFRPGFSTAASVTGISGRGVGLDVVRANVSQLGGKVVIRQVSPGTAFELRLPVRLAATDVVLVQAGGQTFAVALDDVRETLTVASDRVRRVAGRPAIVHQGRIVPIVSLAEVVGLGANIGTGVDERALIVAAVAGQLVGLAVDKIGRHQQVVAKPLASYLAWPGLSGAAVLGDGRVVLVVWPARLIASALAAPPATA